MLFIASSEGAQVPDLLLASVGLISVLIAMRVVPDVLPSSRWRVPRRWSRIGPIRYAGSFGVLLGLGFLTARPAVSFWFLIAALLSLNEPRSALLVMALFGLGRGVATLPVATGRNPSFWYARMATFAAASRAVEVPFLCLLTLMAMSRCIA